MITLDWDDVSEYEAKDRLRILRRLFPEAEIWYRRSSGGKGWHVKIRLRYQTSDTVFAFRALFWDDPSRLMYDMARRAGISVVDYTEGVVFDRSRAKDAGPWIPFDH
jgi:hypothetical protein